MKRRGAMALIALNLVAIIGLALIYPHLMVGPGPVRAEHAKIATQCFACHSPWRGVSSERCIVCHAVADIGRVADADSMLDIALTRVGATGRRSARALVRLPAFHQALASASCTECHSDHSGPRLTEDRPPHFEHSLLPPNVRGTCGSCHAPPPGAKHATFGLACAKCHANSHWTPSTFDHSTRFELDRHHDVACATCHRGVVANNYSCFGCHEHSPERIRAKHRKQSGNIDDCVRCHRTSKDE